MNIKIKKDDSIFEVLEKIKNNISKKDNKVMLEIPFWHHILYNSFYLKAIQNFLKDKKLIIITTDIASKKLLKKLWIKYSFIKNKDFLDEKNIIKYNYSFFEYFKYEVKRWFNLFWKKIFKNKKIKELKKKYYLYKKEKVNIVTLIFILITVSLIFLYLFFFSLNKTIVYITPEIEIDTKSKNFIFTKKENSNPKFEQVKEIYAKADVIYTYNTTWIEQKEENRAKIKVQIINKFPDKVKLKPNSRFLTPKWLLFENKKWIQIPPAIKNKNRELIPWIKEVILTAKTFDKFWDFIWKKANKIKTWTILILPWLKENQRDLLFAKVISKIQDWKDEYTHIVTKKDLDDSIKILKEKLKRKAIKSLENKIDKINKENNVTYKILDINNIVDFYDLKTQILWNIKEWDKIKSFNLSWSIKVKSYIYNVDSIISKLKKDIEESIIPEKQKIISIDKNSIRISNIIYRQDNPFYLKATIEVEYLVEYNFENNDDNFVKRLKNTIAWLSIDKAEKILINNPKISDAKIEVRPFFLKNVSKFFDNIKFVIQK